VTSSPAETAVSLSEEFFGAGADVVYVANGSSGVDGLTVGTSAGFVTGPLLLSETDRLPEATMTELRRLALSRIVVIGGTAAISTSVTDALTPLGAAIERVGGANRYETAALLSRLTAPDGADTVYVTTGQGGADALAAASVAGGTGSPVLLTRRDDVPGVTRDELVRLRPRRVIVVGGAAAVSGRS
jgi:putative cell wall-binding protein